MKIILKEHVDFYRYTVAKAVFLMVYKEEYELINDISKSSFMKVNEIEKQEVLYISMFKEPSLVERIWLGKDEHSVKIYYQRKRGSNYEKGVNGEKSKMQYATLNKEFDELYKILIEDAFLYTPHFIDSINNNNGLFGELFQYYFLEAEIKISSYNRNRLFKYFSKDTGEKNQYNTNDGLISFANPKYFNDPFDCNLFLANNEDIRDCFRVLCLTSDNDNILMWSYYSTDHKGYCFEYDNNSIFKQIKNLKIPGICIFGDVNYELKRPNPKSPVSKFSYTDLKHYIDVAFTKYKKWEHEKECRFLIISKAKMEDFIQINPKVNAIYLGSEGKTMNIPNINQEKIEIIRIKKDPDEYRLIRLNKINR